MGRIEAELGEGALDDSRRSTRRGWAGPAASRQVKLVLRAAQRQAIARGDRDLTAEHLLLGIMAQPGLVADALGSRGITVGTALAALDERGSQTGTNR
ncbi:MAG: Clp protease N-terminal domain-containing protein [Egibacteraceae bacterium]